MRATARLLLPLLLLAAGAAAQDAFDDTAAVEAWTKRLAETRQVVDRVVVCFDEASVLREIGKWDAERFWPVLLWDSDLVPKFVEAFGPKQVLLADLEDGRSATVEDALRAVAAAWGVEAGRGVPTEASLLETLRSRSRAPMGAVLLAEGSPELLGGAALAAGRLHLPLVLATAEKHAQVVSREREEALRKELMGRLAALGISFEKRFDDLDFVTVANDAPFGYRPDPDAHPAEYTVDDAIARNDDLTRWGWVGRLLGGPARSVYMVMGALFLQPAEGLLWSRYDPANQVFGAYDPAPAVETFRLFCPVTLVNHPEATLARWRELEWPGGNRFGLVLVNSSGGSTDWSTSQGGATYFDVPDTVPAVVHYTHSGSAGNPFEVDSIAGRWLAGGAYVYFGSYREPYLQSFVSPRVLAARVKAGIPLGAAMRHLYHPGMVGQQTMKVGGADRLVRFNLSGPWKLAYFGDPSYRLLADRPPRAEPEPPGRGYHAGFRAFERARPRTEEERRAHALDAVGIARLDPAAKSFVDERTWASLVKAMKGSPDAPALLRETTRAWTAELRRAIAKADKPSRTLGLIPAPIRGLLEAGADSPDAARLAAEVAKEAVASLPAEGEPGGDDPHRAPGAPDADPTLARRILVAACCFPHSRGSSKLFLDWAKEAAPRVGLDPAELRKEVLAERWLPAAVRKFVEDGLPAAAAPAK